MNVLSDILCSNSPLILSSSYSGPLSSHDAHLTRPLSKQNIMLPNEKDLNLLETLSSMPNLVQTPNTTDVGNGFFHAPESIHASLNLVNSNYPMHQEADPSDFVNDGFHNSIPSWFPKDLIKVSEHISTGCCEPTDDPPLEELCPTDRDENLTMMQLGFSHDMTSQNNAISTMNTNCMPNAHSSMISESQVYSSADSLLMSTFTDMGNFPLSMAKVNRSCDKYNQHSARPYPSNSSQNLINSVLPLDNQLDISQPNQLHLSLANPIVDPHRLSNSANPSIIQDNQNNGHTLGVVRDKRSHISLNQLDFLLDTHNPLNDMQIGSNNFSVDSIAGKQPCPGFAQESVIDTCNGTLGVMSCNNGSLSNLNIHPFNESQDIVDVNALPQLTINSDVNNAPEGDAIDSAVEETKCLKCKYCIFLSLDRMEIRNHIKQVHSKSLNHPQTPSNVFYPGNMLSTENSYCNPSLSVVTVDKGTENILGSDTNKNFICNVCVLSFDSAESFKAHTLAVHNCRPKPPLVVAEKNRNENGENVLKKAPLENTSVINESLHNYGNTPPRVLKETCHERTALLDSDQFVKNNNESTKKNNSVKKSNVSEENIGNLPRRMSSHKKAWQRKIKRELSSYICEFKGCNVRFHFLDNLEYHRKCHITGTGKFACPECALLFDHWGPTAGHLWRNHTTDMELHVCDQCPYRTYSLSKLENYHKPIHQDKCPFICDICNKTFKTTKQLRHHKATHSKPPSSSLPKNFACFICSRQFATKKFLRVHLLVHNKQKSFLCNVCDYSASKRSTLKMHALKHTGEKPFACTECEFRTADHNTFRRHKMKHSGEKPYKCPFCSYACIQSSTYKVHIKRQHPGQEHTIMFSCSICSFRSVKQDNYNAHMADHEMEKVSRLGNNLIRETDLPQQQESEVLPLVEAMDISLSHGDRSILISTNKDSLHFCVRTYNEDQRFLNQ